MPWVRIDENAMDHPKIGALPDGAFRLWVQALAYCQKFLTDGAVSDLAVKGLRSYSAKRRALLVSAGLWDVTGAGISVHDFLDWNDSRAEVVRAREDARERRRRYRERHASTDADSTANVSSGVVCSEDSRLSQEREGGAGGTNAVQRFVDRHRELYAQFCGVNYIGNPQKDYTAAGQIVQAFPHPAMQDAILTYGLNDPDPFMAKDTRTIPKIACRASKYAEELKAKKLA